MEKTFADGKIWLRSCTNEVNVPITGHTKGEVPKWLKGTLLRNGPGKLKFGDMEFKHLFDSSALLHRFCINDGKVTYQRKFLQTKAFKANHAAQRIVINEFGTKAVPDPCQSIFQRVAAALFKPDEAWSDNANISVYPFGDEFYCFTETPVIHRIDPKTLETTDRVNVSNNVAIVNHTSHPHVMNDGTVYNVGLSMTLSGPKYSVVEFAPQPTASSSKSMFDEAKIVASIPCRWKLNPGYMHSFGITEKYFIIIEQPLSMNIPSLLKNTIKSDALVGCLKWYNDEMTQILLISREDGECKFKFVAETFFFFHVINSFDEGDNCIIDICCYDDANLIDYFYIESLKDSQKTADYAKSLQSKPLRFIMPLKSNKNIKDADENLITNLPWKTSATAHLLPDGKILVKPEQLYNFGCEMPRVNNEKSLGKPYRYFYAVSSPDSNNDIINILKIDTLYHTADSWGKINIFPSEPVFVPNPDAKNEDDGVILSALIWGGDELENKVGLLILDAKTFTEIAQVTFVTVGAVPKCLHGWFAENVV